jgi:hypothetical protein
MKNQKILWITLWQQIWQIRANSQKDTNKAAQEEIDWVYTPIPIDEIEIIVKKSIKSNHTWL